MEWLSAEEKTRSMMPYLLDLPPLDKLDEPAKDLKAIEQTDAKTQKVVINKPKAKKSDKEIEMDK